MFTAGRILRNLNRGDPNAGPVNSVLISQPKKDKRKFRCYVPFVWQALMATCIGFLVILIGITLCVVGYYADHIQSLTAPRRLDNVTSALSLAREKYATEGKVEEGGGSGGRGESTGTGYNYLRCMIYIGPALMSCGSFAIVFSCVVVCETRDKLLEFMDEREKSNLPRKASNLKFDFFRSIVSPTSAGRRQPNNTTVVSGIDVFSSIAERPKPIRPASLSVAEFDAGQKRCLLPDSEADDRFSSNCRTENDRFDGSLGYNAERMGTSQGPEFNPFSANQLPVLDPVSTNHRPDLDRFSASCRTETGGFSTDIGCIADYLDADHRSELDKFSSIQNQRPTGTVIQRTEVATSDSCLSVITAPIDRSLRCLPQSSGHNESLVTASTLGSRESDHRSLDEYLSSSWRTDSNRWKSSGSPNVCRREAVRRASVQNPKKATAQLPNNCDQTQMTLLKTDEDENQIIAQRLTKGSDGLRHGPVDRQGAGPVLGPVSSCNPGEDNHHRHTLLEVSRNTADSTRASGVTGRRSPPGVASSRLTSGSLQSISGAIVQFRPQTLAGQQSVHIIHKAHVHQEPIPRPTFSTLPLRFSQQQQQLELQPEVEQEQCRLSLPFSVTLAHSTATE